MAELRRYEYGDPLKVLEQREAQTCKGCVFLTVWKAGQAKVELCRKGRKVGRRCKQYTGAE